MKKKPEFMMIHQCSKCGMESGCTEQDTAVCYYCDEKTEMKLIFKQEITPELIEQRLKKLSESMLTNLQSAFELMTEEDKACFNEGVDPEKEMLLLLDRTKKYKDTIVNLTLSEPNRSPKE